MMNIYLDIMSKMGGFMTNKDKLHLPRIELFLQEVARREPLYVLGAVVNRGGQLG